MFFFSKAGVRDEKYFNLPNRKRKHRPLTRFECPVKLVIKFSWEMDLWYVDKYIDSHNHELARPNETTFLRSHRKMTEW